MRVAWRTLCVGGGTCALPYSQASDLGGRVLLGEIDDAGGLIILFMLRGGYWCHL